MAYTNTAAYGGSDPPSPNTTFVQADPSTFRTIVQKLTGAPDDSSTQKLPITHSNRPLPLPVPGPKRPAFKLNERRQSAKHLQINLVNNNPGMFGNSFEHFPVRQHRGGNNFMVSPVSTLDFIAAARMSPNCEEDEEEERVIAEKGFYLRPVSPLGTAGGAEPPQLLPLFPLRSPNSDIVQSSYDSSF